MGSSTELSDPHFMGFDVPISKVMIDVKSDWCKAVGPGTHFGVIHSILGAKAPQAQFLVQRWTWVNCPPHYWFRLGKFCG